MYQIAEQRWLCKVTDLLKGLCRICICLLYATHRPYPSLACVLMFCIILKMVFAKPAYNVQLLGAVQPHCVSAAETKAHYSLMFTFEKATDRSSYVTAWPHHTSKSQNTYIYICIYAGFMCVKIDLKMYALIAMAMLFRWCRLKLSFPIRLQTELQSVPEHDSNFPTSSFFFLCEENFWCCWYFGNTALV